MARKRHFAVCVEAFEHVIPATQLEIRGFDGTLQTTIEVGEKRTPYAHGQQVEFGTVKAMRAFCAAHGGKFQPHTTEVSK